MVEDMARTSFPFGAFPGSAASMSEQMTFEIWSRDRGLEEAGQRKRRVCAQREEAATYCRKAWTGQRG